MRSLYIILFKWTGWKIIGDIPEDLNKYVMIIAPHTSFHDFFIGYGARGIKRLKTHFVAKKELFWFPLGPILKWMGGYPVDRKKNERLVDRVVEIFNSKDTFSIALAPEGTRKKVPRLRSGFYHIAKNAGIPIVMVGFDYKKKTVEIRDPIFPGANKENDFQFMWEYYRGVTGKHPELGIF